MEFAHIFRYVAIRFVLYKNKAILFSFHNAGERINLDVTSAEESKRERVTVTMEDVNTVYSAIIWNSFNTIRNFYANVARAQKKLLSLKSVIYCLRPLSG